MDFGNDNEMAWNWQDIYFSLPEEPQHEISTWIEDATSPEDISYMINDTNTTPVKACLDVQWKFSESDKLLKEYEESKASSSQTKRRRVLKFHDEPIEFPLYTEELSPAYLKTKATEESVKSLVPEIPPWDGTSDFVPASNFKMTGQDHWLAKLLNDCDMNSEDMTLSGASDVQFDISDFCESQLTHEPPPIMNYAMPLPPAPTPAPKTLTGKVVFKGKTSYIKTPVKPASSVAYPFTFIKPCPEKGGMTLQDINKKIHTPPRKPIPPNLPKSAFSGKLVVGKTRIRTGGNGSINITRTRG